MKTTLAGLADLNAYLKQVPFKGTAVVDAAIILVAFSPHIKVMEEVRNQLLQKHNEGKAQFSGQSDPKLAAFLEEFTEAMKKDVEVSVKKIKIEAIDSTRQAGQEAIAELIKAGILEE